MGPAILCIDGKDRIEVGDIIYVIIYSEAVLNGRDLRSKIVRQRHGILRLKRTRQCDPEDRNITVSFYREGSVAGHDIIDLRHRAIRTLYTRGL